MYKKCFNDINDLPYKESMTKNKDFWDYGKSDLHKVNNRFPWTHVQRTLEKYKGKNADKRLTNNVR